MQFNAPLLESLLARMVRDGVHLDAISWHELGEDPDVVPQHVEAMRALLRKYPGACTPKCPEIHVNEYEGDYSTFIPGNAVGWLVKLEAAAVDQANRACWGRDEIVNYESCWYGFSGMLTADSASPQPIYWVYKFYADLNGSRFNVRTSTPKVAVLSGRVAPNKVGVLIGNYGQASLPMQIVLTPMAASRSRRRLPRGKHVQPSSGAAKG